MPAVVDPARCNRNWAQCFPAKMCPQEAFSVDADGLVQIAFELCGDCPGPCVNFCDGYAIRYERDPGEFDIMRRRLLGELSEDDAIRERQELARAQEEARKAQAAVRDVTLETFETEVLESDIPVVVDFWAPWCGPCKKMAPIFEEVAGKYAGKVKFVKVNTEDQPQLAAHFRITSIPTLMVFSGRKVIDGAIGALPRAQLVALVERVLAAHAAPRPSPQENQAD